MSCVQSGANGSKIARASGFSTTQKVTISSWIWFNSTGGTQLVWSHDDNSTFCPQVYLSGTTLTWGQSAGSVNILTGIVANEWYWLCMTMNGTGNAISYTARNGQGLTRTLVESSTDGWLGTSPTLTFFDEVASDFSMLGRQRDIVILSGPNAIIERPIVELLYRKPLDQRPDFLPNVYAWLPLDTHTRAGVDQSGKGRHFTASGSLVTRVETPPRDVIAPRGAGFLGG